MIAIFKIPGAVSYLPRRVTAICSACSSMCLQPKWYQKVPYPLPILLISGEMDPVGDYGKGVRQVYRDLKRRGMAM